MNLETINEKLQELALKKTTPFCYMCYQKAPTGTCGSCHSDDMMRHLDGVGVEYGTCWVIEHILAEELQVIDQEEIFEQMIDECYSEQTQIGFLNVSTSYAMKQLDPIAWDIAKGEYISSLEEDDQVYEVQGSYYWAYEIEKLF